MVCATERVVVRFDGDGAGEGELSWGQLHLWLGMRRRKTWLPLEMFTPLPEGTSVEAALEPLRFMLCRYPSLRTRLRFGFEDDLPRQVVAADGELPVEIFDAEAAGDAGDDPAALATAVAKHYRDLPYDFTTDWPLRAALVRHRDRLTHRVTVTCHLAIDGGSLPVIARDLAERDPVAGRTARPPTPMQPLELARWQRTQAARRQSEATVRHHEQILRTMPPQRLGTSGDQRRPRYWRFGFRSPAAYLAARAIAARTGTDQATVALTLWAVALGRVTGVNPVVCRVVVSNRFRTQLAELVGPVIQDGLLMVDLAGLGFDEAVVRTRRRAMGAYKYGFFDPRDLYRAEERISRERGEPVEVGCIFNDRRAANLDPTAAATAAIGAGEPPTGAEIRAALARTELWCELQQDHDPHAPLFLHINNVPETIDVSLLTDTHRIAPGDAETLLRELEAVAVAAAADPASATLVAGTSQEYVGRVT
jgi:condensation domain-containing protein